jgi:hypothetical protein
MFARSSLPLLLALALLAGPTGAWAQGGAKGTPAQVDPAMRAAMLGERQRLRVELERANAEIDALKHANRSLRDDYRLRARLADAEALARRLTDLEARLGGVPRQGWTGPDAEPRGLPSDGPAELEAKADILADQARRLAARGDGLLNRARELRARQNLRRRVGQMERDPFSPLEGSKRRTMAAGTVAAAPGNGFKAGPPAGGGATDRGQPGGGNTGSTPVSGQQDSTPPPSSTPPTSTGAASPGAGPASISSTPPTSTPPAGGLAVTAPKTAPTPATPASLGDSATLSAQLRDLLDPATLAELQRLEATSGAVSGVEALERAGAALKARAERLEREAAALRAARGR